jgi:tetratricopeptide (TPR) repeat protein
LNRALTLSPDDTYTLSLFGILRFRQERHDDALTLLQRAGQLDPKNAEIRNYLGITLSQKGRSAEALEALEKAVQLAPNYAGAHHNLAVILAFKLPPDPVRARSHYEKALELRHPRNPELEKLLGNAAAVPSPNPLRP